MDEGVENSTATNITLAGAATLVVSCSVAAATILARAVWRFMFGESSSDQQEHKGKAKSASSKSTQSDDDFYTLHYSGSDINQHQKGGAGCIIRSKQGELVIAAANNVDNLYPGQFHVAIGEAIAWRKGLELAKNKKVKLDLIKGDNQEVIKRVCGQQEKAPGVPFLNKIIGEIREALQEQEIDPRTQVERIGKQDNKVANELAYFGSDKLGSGKEKVYSRDVDLPVEVAKFYQQDRSNWRD